jgi:hypothetical protein
MTNSNKNVSNKVLKDEIFSSLQENGLIGEPKPELFYRPTDRSQTYKKVRRFIMEHRKVLGYTGIGMAGFLAALFPEARKVAAGVAGVGVLGALAPLDKIFYRNPGFVAARKFMSTDRKWGDMYDAITPRGRSDLDDLVVMAQNSKAVAQDFGSPDQQSGYGVAIAAIADMLHDENRKLGIVDKDIVDFTFRQKLPEKDWQAMRCLIKNYTSKQATNMLRSYRFGGRFTAEEDKGLERLHEYCKDHELTLKLGCVAGPNIGSQLSKGHIVISQEAPGGSIGGYMGIHSEGKDFPRITAKGDVGMEFMTNCRMGFSWISGDVKQRIMEHGRGGIVGVEGIVDSQACDDMTDDQWPSILIAIGGLNYALHNVADGLVVALCTNNEFRTYNDLFGEPMAYRFKDGAMVEKHKLEGNALTASIPHIKGYIDEWADVHQR